VIAHWLIHAVACGSRLDSPLRFPRAVVLLSFVVVVIVVNIYQIVAV